MNQPANNQERARLDTAAVILSGICMLHCLALPVVLTIFPIFNVALLDEHAAAIGAPGNTFCLHATGAMEPMLSALVYFRDEFEAHIAQGRCPYQEPGGRDG